MILVMKIIIILRELGFWHIQNHSSGASGSALSDSVAAARAADHVGGQHLRGLLLPYVCCSLFFHFVI